MAPHERLPPEFAKTRQIYKLQSQKVIQWVITTSAGLLKPLDTNTNTTPSKQQGGKKKGKGKGNQRGPAASKGKNPYAPATTLAGFTERVNQIVAAKVRAPSEIIASLANVIKFRKICAAFFSADAEEWKSNKSHQHAIGVFVDAWVKLGGKTADSEDIKVNRDGFLASQTEEELAALLDKALVVSSSVPSGKAGTVENEWLRDNPLVNKNVKSKAQQQQREFPMEDYKITDDEAEHGPDAEMMAIIAFFCDVENIRKYCNRVWKQVVPAGEISRVSASLVTTQAVELVKRLEKDLMAEFPLQLRSIADIYLRIEGRLVPQALKLTDEELYVIKDKTLGYAFQYLHSFEDVIQPGCVPALKPDYFGTYYANNRRSKMSVKQKEEEDRVVLLSYFPEMCTLLSICPPASLVGLRPRHLFLGDDGFGLEFSTYFKKRGHPITLSLCFASTMILDIFYIRRDAGYDDCKAMREFYKKVRSNFDKLITDPDYYMPENIPKLLEVLRGIRQLLDDQMGTDTVYEWKKHNGDWRLLAGAQRDMIWTRNPWLATNAMTYALTTFWEYGSTLTQCTTMLQSVIELWNFLKQLGYLDDFFKDEPQPDKLLIEYLIDNFSQQLFVRGKPLTDNFVQCSFMNDNNMVMPEISGTQTAAGINMYMSEIFNMYTSKNGLSYELNRITKKRSTDRKRKGAAGALSTKSAQNPLFAVDEHNLLYPLATTLELAQTELGKTQPIMGLDWFKMHHTSFKFLAELYEEIKEDVKERLVLERNNQLPYVALDLMLMTLMAERDGRNKRKLPLLRKVARRVVDKVGTWKMEDFVLDLI